MNRQLKSLRHSADRGTSLAGVSFFRASLFVAMMAGMFILTSCEVGPNYHRPPMPVPSGFESATTQESAANPRLGANWWELFGDSELNELEKQATIANPGLRAAMDRVLAARQAARITGAQFYPVITANPQISRSRSASAISGSRGGSGNSTTQTSAGGVGAVANNSQSINTQYQIPFDLSYEVDIWGQVRRQYQSSVATARASAFDFEVVMQTLQADVAQDYFIIRSLDAQEEILRQTVDSFRRQVDLTKREQRFGIVGQIDVAQAEAQLNSTITQEVETHRQRVDEEHALAILLGRAPSELSVPPRPLNIAPPAIPVGLPAQLLRRRPDVLEAEQNLVSANAQVGVAVGAFYPQLNLDALAGFDSLDLAHAVDWQNRVWSIGSNLAIPIFEGGRLKASYRQAKANYDQQLANYRTTFLQAVEDVEDSLNDVHLRADEAATEDKAVEAADAYVKYSNLEYQQGIISELTVVDAERTLLSNQMTAAQNLEQRMISMVLLVKALGGGWNYQAPIPHLPPSH